MAKIYHPDINHSNDAAEMFILVREAYNFLYHFYKETNKTSVETVKGNSNIPNNMFYENWLNQERAKVRKQAAYEAKMKFESFKKTKVYKTARVFSKVLNVTISFSGIFIIAAASYGLFQRGLTIYENGIEKVNINGIVTAFFVSIVGIVLIVFSHAERKHAYK